MFIIHNFNDSKVQKTLIIMLKSILMEYRVSCASCVTLNVQKMLKLKKAYICKPTR